MLRNLLNSGKLSTSASIGILLLRIISGAAMMTHGYPKLLKLLAGPPYKFADPIGLGITFSLILVVFAEFFCSALIILGLGTRLAAIPLFITTVVIVFISKTGKPFEDFELPLLYLVIFASIAFTGAGKFSLDKKWLKA